MEIKRKGVTEKNIHYKDTFYNLLMELDLKLHLQ